MEIQQKLKLLPGYSALILNAPPEYLKLISSIPFDNHPNKDRFGKYDFVQIFGSERSNLEALAQEHSGSGKYDCLFWICYPKLSGNIQSDLTRNVIWEISGSIGMRCVTQIAIDETWSALRCRPIELVSK
jgi:hypothetical protein